MNSTEQELFKCMSVAIMFRLGFQSLLTAAARQKGQHGMQWLDEFEARVVANARQMSVRESIPASLVDETVDSAVKEFSQVFAAVRRKLSREQSGGRSSQMERSDHRGRRSTMRPPRRSS